MTSEKLEILPNSPRSYGDITSENINSELSLLFGGYIIMFIYTVVMLGKVNMVEMRVLLSAIGIISIGMGIFIAICIRYWLISTIHCKPFFSSSALGFPYTTTHQLLPLLGLGIGIDDMFVIMQSLTNVKKNKEYSHLSSGQKIAQALKYSGVAITVTSITDVFVFAVGAATVGIIWNLLLLYAIFLDYAWSAVLLCCSCNWTWKYISSSNILVYRMAITWWKKNWGKQKWSDTMLPSQPIKTVSIFIWMSLW